MIELGEARTNPQSCRRDRSGAVQIPGLWRHPRRGVCRRRRAVVKYNLGFIHLGLCQQDNGRVLGYDNAHGHHERHWMGSKERVVFINYERTLRRFLDEVEALKEKA